MYNVQCTYSLIYNTPKVYIIIAYLCCIYAGLPVVLARQHVVSEYHSQALPYPPPTVCLLVPFFCLFFWGGEGGGVGKTQGRGWESVLLYTGNFKSLLLLKHTLS